MQMDEAKKDKKFPKGCGAFMEDRSSRTNKYSGLKGPILGPRQKQMGGEGLLYTCPAVYIPFLKTYSGYFSSVLHRKPAATETLPSQLQPMSQCQGNLKMCQQTMESPTCSSKPSKKPFLSWVEAAGARNFWINQSLLHCSLNVFCWGEGHEQFVFSAPQRYTSKYIWGHWNWKTKFHSWLIFFSRWKCSSNCFLLFDLSISFG